MSVYKSKWKCAICGKHEVARWNHATEQFEIQCGCGKTTAKDLAFESWEFVNIEG